MRQPLQITYQGLQRSDALDAAIRQKAEHLDHFCDRIMACRVAVEVLQKHQHQGRPFGVRIDLTMPGHELVVNRVANEDVYVALRDAFDKMKRQVEEVARQDRGEVKQHAQAPRGAAEAEGETEGEDLTP